MATNSLPASSHNSLTAAANLANLLPTGTVLAFQVLIPSFSNNGECELANKCLSFAVLLFCSTLCFLSSFTDSFTGKNGKLYYGIATMKGLHVFNGSDSEEHDQTLERQELMAKYRIRLIDFVHAFTSLMVFLVLAVSNSNVETCFFPKAGANVDALLQNLPLGAAFLSSFLFLIFPTKRRGIGIADVANTRKHVENSANDHEVTGSVQMTTVSTV